MPRLDRIITVFKLTEDENGNRKRVNVAKNIRASFRQLSDDERVATHENGTDSTAQFEINRRPIYTDEYVEYTRKTYGTSIYQIVSIDPFNEHEGHIKIKCKLVEHKINYESEVDE